MSSQAGPFRVAIYARVSTKGQAERDLSVPEQIDAVTRYCEERSWPVVAVFKDAGFSGAAQVSRKQFQAMMNEGTSKKPRFNLVLTRDSSRFGRGDADMPNREKLRANGVRVDNIQSPVGDTKARGLGAGEKFQERMKNVVDIYQREQVTEVVIPSMQRMAREGKITGRQGTMFGYASRWEGDGPKPTRVVELHPENAKVVREMFQLYADGDSIKAVTRWLNDSGIAPPGNGKRAAQQWYDTTVRSILTNETALGTLVYGRIRKVKHKVTETKVNVKNTGDVIRTEGVFPPLVDRKLFDQVQARLASNDRTVPGRGNPGNTLRGIGQCGTCGWHLAHQRNNSTNRWYYMCGRVKMHKAPNCDPHCKGILQADYVDEVVELFLRQTVSTPGYAETIRAAVETYNDTAREFKGVDAFAALDDTIRKLETTVDNLATQVKRTGSARLADMLVEEEAKLADAARRRGDLASTIRVECLDEPAILRAAKDMRAALRSNDRERMIALLPELVSSVEVDWSRRTNPVVGFNYLREGADYSFDVGEPLHGEELRAAKDAVARMTMPSADAFIKAIESEMKRPTRGKGAARIAIAEPNVPLTFVAKWDLSNLARVSEDALRRIGAALEA
jgi:site-specific DNA recombinase